VPSEQKKGLWAAHEKVSPRTFLKIGGKKGGMGISSGGGTGGPKSLIRSTLHSSGAL